MPGSPSFEPVVAARVPWTDGRWRRAALATAVLLLWLGAAATAAESAPRRIEIRRAAEAVLSGGTYQQIYPQVRPAPERDAETAGPAVEYAAPLLGVGKMLLWVMALVGGGLIIAFVASELARFAKSARGGKRDDRDAATLSTSEGPDRQAAAGTLADAERLAGAGQYGEAIHALLLACLEELRRRFDPGQPPSLTSREIARRLALNESAKAAFATIVAAAELSHFGEWNPGASDYGSCLESYRHITAEAGVAP